MPIPFTPLVESLPASTPFVGPETLERQRGKRFTARIGANESAFGISSMAEAAMIAAISERAPSWYADPENFQLRQALAEKHNVAIDEICVDGGIDSLLGLTARMLLVPGASVVTSAGAYPTFNYHVHGFGGQLHTVPYADNHEDPDALIQAARSHNAALVYLSNPDNPMGTFHSSDTVGDMIKQVPENCVLLLDEAYIEFTDKALAPPIDTSNKKIMRFRTFSKAYGMAGMRVGYVIAHRDIIVGLNKIRNHFAINRLSQIAATASLQDSAFLNQVKVEVAQGRQRIYDLADSLSLPWLESATNFVAVDVGSSDRAKNLLSALNEQNVFMRMPGVAPLNTHIRVGVGTQAEHDYFVNTFKHLMENQVQDAQA